MTAAQGVKDYIGPLKFGDWHVGQLQWNRVKKVLFGNVRNFAFIAELHARAKRARAWAEPHC